MGQKISSQQKNEAILTHQLSKEPEPIGSDVPIVTIPEGSVHKDDRYVRTI